MSKATFTVADDKKTLIVERTFPANRTRVWSAYTKPELLAQWWGPRGWQTEIRHMDFSEGEYWHYGMKCMDPDQSDWYGKTSWGKGTFLRIIPEESFEYTDEFCDENGKTISGMPVSHTVITFSDEQSFTTVTSKTEYETAEALAQVLEMGMQEGFTQTWDRFEEFLESL
jgi:uncharacterized protein YndB with AHSA1/START domain